MAREEGVGWPGYLPVQPVAALARMGKQEEAAGVEVMVDCQVRW